MNNGDPDKFFQRLPQQMNHKHIYDEYGLCFECDKPKPRSRADDMKKSRQRRKDAGLVEFRAWVTPEEKQALIEYWNRIKDYGGEKQ